MSDNSIMLVIIGMAIVTYLPRLIPILVLSQWETPVWLKNWMKYIPVSIFSSLIAKDLFFDDTGINLSIYNTKLLASVVVAFVAYKSKSIVLSIGIGITILILIGAD